MQLGAAAVFLLEAVSSVAVSLLFTNHDSMLKALQAQGNLVPPPGSSVDDLVNISIAFATGVLIFFAVLELIGAVGSFLGWRWMFWAALVLFGLGGLGSTFGNVPALLKPASSPVPVGGLIVSELIGLLALAMFVWMLIGVIRYGPWAMQKPGGAR